MGIPERLELAGEMAKYGISGIEAHYPSEVNSQPLGNYDQDLNVGVVNWQDTEALSYALKMVGYRGFFGIDINPSGCRCWRRSRSTRGPCRS
jgi:hypothetical protein